MRMPWGPKHKVQLKENCEQLDILENYEKE